MQSPNFDFLKEFDEVYFPPTNAWDMCCDGYFVLLGIEKNELLVNGFKPYFGHVFKEYKLSLLGAMIAFGEILYYQNIRLIYEKTKKFPTTNPQEADKFLFICVHLEHLSAMCKYSKQLKTEFTKMHDEISKMHDEMKYIPNYANMPALPSPMKL